MSTFPFVQPQEVSEQSESLPLFKEYAYDFDNNRLALHDENGKNYLVEGNTALLIWIFKVLHTARYKHIAYSRDYGCEVKDIIGKVTDSNILKSEIKRLIIETLMVNPYIKSLSNFKFDMQDSMLIVNFIVTTVYDEMPMNFKVERR